jgi:hypothetical protein
METAVYRVICGGGDCNGGERLSSGTPTAKQRILVWSASERNREQEMRMKRSMRFERTTKGGILRVAK